MMSYDELLSTKREDILRIAAKYGAYNVRIFGSVARGEADEQSDIDFLMNMEPGRSLFDLGGRIVRDGIRIVEIEPVNWQHGRNLTG